MKKGKACLAWLLCGMFLLSVAGLGNVAMAADDELAVTSDIVIDGYYEDWEGYPVTEITYLSNNTYSIHTGQICTDGEWVYVHFSMNDLYQNQIMMQTMTITINGVNYPIGLYPVTDGGAIDWAFYSSMGNSLPNGSHFNYGVIVNYYMYCESSGVITIYDSEHKTDTKGDEVEFRFSLKDFGKLVGAEMDNVTSLAIVNPNIGSQEVVWVGTSSGPWIGVASMSVLAGVGAMLCIRRKKQVVVECVQAE